VDVEDLSGKGDGRPAITVLVPESRFFDTLEPTFPFAVIRSS
jgi:hypothetical protein